MTDHMDYSDRKELQQSQARISMVQFGAAYYVES